MKKLMQKDSSGRFGKQSTAMTMIGTRKISNSPESVKAATRELKTVASYRKHEEEKKANDKKKKNRPQTAKLKLSEAHLVPAMEKLVQHPMILSPPSVTMTNF
jgi:Sec-independent protein translocase protein TatA